MRGIEPSLFFVEALDQHIKEDAKLRGRRLAGWRYTLCCSPGYLKSHPAPHTPADLADHNCLLYLADAQQIVSEAQSLFAVPQDAPRRQHRFARLGQMRRRSVVPHKRCS